MFATAPAAYDEVEQIRTEIGNLIAGADGFAQVFPQHKFIIVDVLRQLGYRETTSRSPPRLD